MNYAKCVSDLVGKTPLLRLKSISEESGALILGKCEFMNPGGSVKDRVGFYLIEDALQKGLIKKNSVVIEPTSGNTGVALASACAAKGIKLILTMPSSMSCERRKLLKALGAELVLTPAELGMKGAVIRAEELVAQTPNAYMAQQFKNPANPEIHSKTTALEIYEALDGKIDYFVAAVGTGGTITGVGKVLKEKIPGIKIVAVEPKESPVLSGGKPGHHKLQGIGAGFIPDVLDRSVFDEIILVNATEAMEQSRRLGNKEGVLVGISSGANMHASLVLGKRKENIGKTIVTILCDTGERYLSTDLYGVEES